MKVPHGKLPRSFYERNDVVSIARDLIGKYLLSQIDGSVVGGLIVETEAYRGYEDRACHANDGRRTKRTEIMYQQGGRAYVYLCYGIHRLFNVVTNRSGRADAILVRAIQPVFGLEVMMKRRKLEVPSIRISSGPGMVSQALGIGLDHYGTDLTKDLIWIEEGLENLRPSQIQSGPRIGVAYAKEHALYPWRFWLSGNPWVSHIKSNHALSGPGSKT